MPSYTVHYSGSAEKLLLFEVPRDLGSLIRSGQEEFVLKGENNVSLCSSKSTWPVTRIQTSNSVMLAEGLPTSTKPPTCPDPDIAQTAVVDVAATVSCHFKCAPSATTAAFIPTVQDIFASSLAIHSAGASAGSILVQQPLAQETDLLSPPSVGGIVSDDLELPPKRVCLDTTAKKTHFAVPPVLKLADTALGVSSDVLLRGIPCSSAELSHILCKLGCFALQPLTASARSAADMQSQDTRSVSPTPSMSQAFHSQSAWLWRLLDGEVLHDCVHAVLRAAGSAEPRRWIRLGPSALAAIETALSDPSNCLAGGVGSSGGDWPSTTVTLAEKIEYLRCFAAAHGSDGVSKDQHDAPGEDGAGAADSVLFSGLLQLCQSDWSMSPVYSAALGAVAVSPASMRLKIDKLLGAFWDRESVPLNIEGGDHNSNLAIELVALLRGYCTSLLKFGEKKWSVDDFVHSLLLAVPTALATLLRSSGPLLPYIVQESTSGLALWTTNEENEEANVVYVPTVPGEAAKLRFSKLFALQKKWSAVQLSPFLHTCMSDLPSKTLLERFTIPLCDSSGKKFLVSV